MFSLDPEVFMKKKVGLWEVPKVVFSPKETVWSCFFEKTY